MLATLVMTIIGPDRTGLVNSLAQTVADHGGNWLESRMCHLGGQFAGLVQVEIDETQAEALRTHLAGLTDSGLQIMVQSDGLTPAFVPTQLVMVDMVGQDRPGLLRAITGVFAQHQLNIEELESERSDAPQGGGVLFKANATLSIPTSADLDAIGNDLERIAADLLVDIRMAPDPGA
jgi:glycine cleavage system regulatory protein